MKVQVWIIIAIVTLAFILGALFIDLNQRLQGANREIERLEYNYDHLVDSTHQNLALILTLQELLSVDTLKIDSLSKALKIRPKTITKYIEVEKTIHDTIDKPVYVYPVKDTWLLADSGKCWVWEAVAKISNDSLKVNRTNFDYHDKLTQFFFWEREKKFLFIHFGKKRYYQKSYSDCGTDKTLVIDIKKK
jgi:hypothetical protein